MTAVFSPCLTWRYRLSRCWDDVPFGSYPLTVVMLNPSTADETQDDPTIRRVRAFAKAWGHAGIDVLNLFALRSTDPFALSTAADPVGPENDATLRTALAAAKHVDAPVLAAWGVHGGFRGRAFKVTHMVDGVRWICLGTTKEGAPRHPLYVPAKQKPVAFGGAS